MNIAYISFISSDSNGIKRKIREQTSYWKESGHNVKEFFLTPHNSVLRSDYIIWKRYNIFNATIKLILDIKKYKPDCIYMREDTLPLSRFLRFIFWYKKIILEINSNYDSESKLNYTNSIKNKYLYYINYFINHIFYKYVCGIVCISYEISHLPHFFDKKNKIVIPNVIPIDNFKIIKKVTSTPPISLFFIGSPNQPWHGIDKIIQIVKILGNGYNLHLIGPSYNDIYHTNPSPNIFVHGYLDNYDHILSRCHIGISTLALHRINMNEASPLKTREYLAKGFPVIIAYDDTSFIKLEETPEFILKLDNCENCVNYDTIRNIKEFCLKNYSRIVLHEEIYDFIDNKIFENSRLSFIENCLK